MKIEIGTRLYCNWGAMHPTEEATVTENPLGSITYVTDNCMTGRCSVRDVRVWGDGNPSPIGVFFLDSIKGK